MLMLALALLLPQDGALPPVTPATCREAGELFDDAVALLDKGPFVDLAKMPADQREAMAGRQAALKAMADRWRTLASALDARYRLRPPAQRGLHDTLPKMGDRALEVFANRCLSSPR